MLIKGRFYFLRFLRFLLVKIILFLRFTSKQEKNEGFLPTARPSFNRWGGGRGGSQASVVVSRHLDIPSLPKPDYITLEIYSRYQNSFT